MDVSSNASPAVAAQFSGCAFCAMMGNWTSVFLKKGNIYSAGGTIPVLETIVLITVLSTKFVGYLYGPRLKLIVI